MNVAAGYECKRDHASLGRFDPEPLPRGELAGHEMCVQLRLPLMTSEDNGIARDGS